MLFRLLRVLFLAPATRLRRKAPATGCFFLLLGTLLSPTASPAACFENSMMQGQDPTVMFKDGIFHLVQSDGCRIRLRRATGLAGLTTAPSSIIHSPGCSELWAPELHFISNRWYLYYTLNTNLDSGGRARRGFVAESQGTSAYGPYTTKGVLFPDWWNIDGNVVTWQGKLYYLFSGEPVTGAQNIYIAPMSNPYTLSGPPVLISAPVQSWERIGTPKVNEGPWGFERGGMLFVVYSASGCWTDDYTLGLLTLTGSDLLNLSSWTKSGPVFTKKAGAYGPGHNSLVQDAGGEWWNVYHANNNPGEGCGGLRRIRAQRVFWKSDGFPDFGSPMPNGSALSDNPGFLVAHFPLLETSGTTAASSVCFRLGAVNGATWANPGLRFSGTNSYVDGGAGLGNDVQHQLTLSAWILPESFNDWAGIITKGTNAAPYAMQLWNDGSLRFTANWGSPAGGVGSGSWNSTRKLIPGQWQHVAVTYDGERLRFYHNGVQDPNEVPVALRFGVVYEPLTIGADLPGGDEFFTGTIRSARVYGRALSAAEIVAAENSPPTLATVTDKQVVAGQSVTLTLAATDYDVPAQKLQYTLLSGPAGATLGSTNGVLAWRAELSQSPSTNQVSLAVKDNGLGQLSATQSFKITVRPPVSPRLSQPEPGGSGLEFQVDGDLGLDYALLSTTNFADWTLIYLTNPVVAPFRISVPMSTNAPQNFYRLEMR